MAKIFLEVHTPGNGGNYEFTTDNDITVGKLMQNIISHIQAFEGNNVAFSSQNALLCSQREEKILIPAQRLWEADIRSGDILLLL